MKCCPYDLSYLKFQIKQNFSYSCPRIEALKAGNIKIQVFSFKTMQSITLVDYANRHDTIKYDISKTENYIYLKKLLAARICERAQDIKLFEQRDINVPALDNNAYISSEELYYTIGEEVSNDIILHIKRNNFGIPKFVQFSKFTTIGQLISELKQLYNIEKNIFILQSNGSLTDNNLTLEKCGLLDNSKVKVWVGDCFKVNITLLDPLRINDESSTQIVRKFEFWVTETVANLKEYIQNEFGQLHNLQLFTDSSFLDDSKYLSSYPLDRECNIYYVDMQKKLDVRITDKIKTGKYADISRAIISTNNRDCVVHEYDQKYSDFNSFKILKYEVVTRLKLPYGSESPFVELISMYIENKKLCIVTEFMARGSLRSQLTAPLELAQIQMYCRQILKGLQFMHGNNIIHRNINCGSVLIDGNGVAKLSNFHRSKFLFDLSTKELMDGIIGTKIEDGVRFVAPEVHLGEPYGFKADVWSFGATLIEMVTRQKPYPQLKITDAITTIINNRTIVYERNRYPGTNLDAIIDMCIQPCQSHRPDAWDLFNLFV